LLHAAGLTSQFDLDADLVARLMSLTTIEQHGTYHIDAYTSRAMNTPNNTLL